MKKQSQSGQLIRAGKTKNIFATGQEGLVLIHTRDTVTVGDGERVFDVPGLGIIRNEISAYCMRALTEAGIRTSFRGNCAGTSITFADSLEMVPLEVVFRFFAEGSYLKRNPGAKQGEEFPSAIIEYFYKDDDNHDPFVVPDGEFLSFHKPKEPVSSISRVGGRSSFGGVFPNLSWTANDFFAGIEQTTRNIAIALRAKFAKQGLVLLDGKFEYGLNSDGFITLGDSIDPDSLRLKNAEGTQLDKQVLRDAVGRGETDFSSTLLELSRRYSAILEAVKKF